MRDAFVRVFVKHRADTGDVYFDASTPHATDK